MSGRNCVCCPTTWQECIIAVTLSTNVCVVCPSQKKTQPARWKPATPTFPCRQCWGGMRCGMRGFRVRMATIDVRHKHPHPPPHPTSTPDPLFYPLPLAIKINPWFVGRLGKDNMMTICRGCWCDHPCTRQPGRLKTRNIVPSRHFFYLWCFVCLDTTGVSHTFHAPRSFSWNSPACFVRNGPIILTGFSALNKLLGREVYTSQDQLGGPQVSKALYSR